MRTSLSILSVAAAFGAMTACGQGPAERAGEAADSAYESATQGEPSPGEGPLERAGERIDRTDPTTGQASEAVREKVQEGAAAAKGAVEPSTQPPPVSTPAPEPRTPY